MIRKRKRLTVADKEAVGAIAGQLWKSEEPQRLWIDASYEERGAYIRRAKCIYADKGIKRIYADKGIE